MKCEDGTPRYHTLPKSMEVQVNLDAVAAAVADPPVQDGTVSDPSTFLKVFTIGNQPQYKIT